jgi:uroporphyrinogen III methyltransferase/synthase
VRPDIVPAEYRAEALVARLRRELVSGDRVLLPRAAQTRDVLVAELRKAGAEVHEIAVYVTRRVERDAGRLREALSAGAVHAVTFTSSSTARNFSELFSDDERRALLAGVTVASIGPITAATAAEYGLTTDVMPPEYTIPALTRALVEYFRSQPQIRARRSRRSA